METSIKIKLGRAVAEKNEPIDKESEAANG